MVYQRLGCIVLHSAGGGQLGIISGGSLRAKLLEHHRRNRQRDRGGFFAQRLATVLVQQKVKPGPELGTR